MWFWAGRRAALSPAEKGSQSHHPRVPQPHSPTAQLPPQPKRGPFPAERPQVHASWLGIYFICGLLVTAEQSWDGGDSILLCPFQWPQISLTGLWRPPALVKQSYASLQPGQLPEPCTPTWMH